MEGSDLVDDDWDENVNDDSVLARADDGVKVGSEPDEGDIEMVVDVDDTMECERGEKMGEMNRLEETPAADDGPLLHSTLEPTKDGVEDDAK